MFVDNVLPVVMVVTKIMLAVLVVIFFISGLDELFMDLFHAFRSWYRRIFVLPKYRPLTEEQLLANPEQTVAVMIPAWDESAVIGRMLDNLARTIRYSDYHVFVGTYPNDPATAQEAERIAARFQNVHVVVGPHDGPTNKADCLNAIYQGIADYEKKENLSFQIFVMSDSEDVPHPLSLKLFNYLIPRKDMVQLPVLPMPVRWKNFTEGHYIDEFAENHSKTMLVRERLSHTIPSAGTGTAFSRHALQTVSESKQGRLFDTGSLTEDYDFALKLGHFNLKQIFVKQGIWRTVTRKRWFSDKAKVTRQEEIIAVRSFFPNKLGDAIRQKTRWVVGISLQGWARLGWKGNGWTKYMLARDRKGLVTNVAHVLGYFVVVLILGLWLARWLIDDFYRYPALVEPGSLTWYLLIVNLGFLLLRFGHRAFFVHRIYGRKQAFLSAPRLVWGNFINFLATIRAIGLYLRHLWNHKALAWDKTDHVFPTAQELQAYRARLGDLLIEKSFLTVEQLNLALAEQKKTKKLLGSILIEQGVVQPEQLLEALGLQLSVSTREIDPFATPLDVLGLVPQLLAARYSIYPLEEDANGSLVLASERILSREEKAQLESSLGRAIRLCLTTQGDVALAIRLGYGRQSKSTPVSMQAPHLGQILLRKNLVSKAELARAYRQQKDSYLRLGDSCVAEGLLNAQQVGQAVQHYTASRNGYRTFGQFLLSKGLLSANDLKKALDAQKKRFRSLGRTLVEMGALSEDALHLALKEQSSASI